MKMFLQQRNEFMNTYKLQLNFFSFFVQLFKDHMYMFFVTGVTFFRYFKDIYEILFHM